MSLLIAVLAILAVVFAILAWTGYDSRSLYLAVIFLAFAVLLIVFGPQLGGLHSAAPFLSW